MPENNRTAAVWIWLPGATKPTLCGELNQEGARASFAYDPAYLRKGGAIALHPIDLPLEERRFWPDDPITLHNPIRDGGPDAWGRRALGYLRNVDGGDLDDLACLLLSGSDRIGALDFQETGGPYEARELGEATLDDLLEASARVESGAPLPTPLGLALLHSTSVGGARPKALITAPDGKHIAKFPSSSDTTNVAKAEFTAMRLAQAAGLDVADVRLVEAGGKDVLLVKRFDRERAKEGWTRKSVLSGLSLLNLPSMFAAYASYEEFADAFMPHPNGQPPKQLLKEVFGRMAFNILCGNTDDHARNHAALWDGETLSLAPAYDVCPQGRAGKFASQAMTIKGTNRESRLAVCLDASESFGMSRHEARQVVDGLIDAIHREWGGTCERARMDRGQQERLWGHQFLNEYAFEGLEGPPAVDRKPPGPHPAQQCHRSATGPTNGG